MADILNAVAASPALALLGAALLLTIILIPIALRLAGLTGQQIVETITVTLQAFIQLVREFRDANRAQKP